MKNTQGFTLIEMLVSMGLVVAVIMITASAFNTILKTTGSLVAGEESNIEGVVGLEMFRHDLEQSGFGLPHAFSSNAPKYVEATVAPANKMNDGLGTSIAGNVPRAIASWNDLLGASDATSDSTVTYNVLAATDYLAIKASSVGASTAAQKWTYLTYSSGGKPAKSWPNPADNLVASDDRVIVVDRSFTPSGGVINTLVTDPNDTSNTYWVNYTNNLFDAAFAPKSAQQIHYLYGIAENTNLAMPFNRADFFVARPSNTQKIPASCAPDVGILYKATVNHGASGGTATGHLTYMPLLDCVADMQVVFGWDRDGTGAIEESSAYESDSAKISVSGSLAPAQLKSIMESPDDIRNKLRYIKVYIMAQEGRKSSTYTNRAPINVGDPTNTGLTKSYSLADLTTKGWLNYHWKIYRIVVKPKNFALN